MRLTAPTAGMSRRLRPEWRRGLNGLYAPWLHPFMGMAAGGLLTPSGSVISRVGIAQTANTDDVVTQTGALGESEFHPGSSAIGLTGGDANVLWLIVATATNVGVGGDRRTLMSNHPNTTGWNGLLFDYADGTTLRAFPGQNSTVSNCNVAVAWPLGLPMVAACYLSCGPSSYVDLFLGQTYSRSTVWAQSSLDAGNDYVNIGSNGGSTTRGWVGTIHFAIGWRGRTFHPVQIARIVADPMGVLFGARHDLAFAAGAPTVPAITAVSAENITATSADYRVTLDYA